MSEVTGEMKDVLDAIKATATDPRVPEEERPLLVQAATALYQGRGNACAYLLQEVCHLAPVAELVNHIAGGRPGNLQPRLTALSRHTPRVKAVPPPTYTVEDLQWVQFRAGMNKAELGAWLGVTPGTVGNYLRGARIPGPVCRALQHLQQEVDHAHSRP